MYIMGEHEDAQIKKAGDMKNYRSRRVYQSVTSHRRERKRQVNISYVLVSNRHITHRQERKEQVNILYVPGLQSGHSKQSHVSLQKRGQLQPGYGPKHI